MCLMPLNCAHEGRRDGTCTTQKSEAAEERIGFLPQSAGFVVTASKNLLGAWRETPKRKHIWELVFDQN